MLWRLVLSILFAAAAAFGAVWPQQIGANQLKSERTIEVTADRALWDEYGLVSATEGDYGAFKAAAYHFKDPTGAFAAAQWIAASNPKTTPAGNYVLTCQGRCPTGQELQKLQFPTQRHDQDPLVWAYLPSKDRISRSGRYAVGPIGLAQFAPQIPAEAAAFQYSTEVAMAKYHTPKGDMQLMLLAFPVPQIARQQEARLAALNGALVKRSGPLVAMVPQPHDAAAAGRLLDAIHYQAQVNWDEKPKPKVTAQGVANMILSIFGLAGLLILFCLAAGLGFAAIKLVRKRLGYESAEEAMIVLHLADR